MEICYIFYFSKTREKSDHKKILFSTYRPAVFVDFLFIWVQYTNCNFRLHLLKLNLSMISVLSETHSFL